MVHLISSRRYNLIYTARGASVRFVPPSMELTRPKEIGNVDGAEQINITIKQVSVVDFTDLNEFTRGRGMLYYNLRYDLIDIRS